MDTASGMMYQGRDNKQWPDEKVWPVIRALMRSNNRIRVLLFLYYYQETSHSIMNIHKILGLGYSEVSGSLEGRKDYYSTEGSLVALRLADRERDLNGKRRYKITPFGVFMAKITLDYYEGQFRSPQVDLLAFWLKTRQKGRADAESGLTSTEPRHTGVDRGT